MNVKIKVLMLIFVAGSSASSLNAQNLAVNGNLNVTGFGTFGSYITTPSALACGTTFKVGVSSTISSGNNYCMAVGQAATTQAYSSVAVGRYNKLEGTPNLWVSTAGALEQLFVVGNGADTNNRNNAFCVYKDGTITMSKAQGDISMGQFAN